MVPQYFAVIETDQRTVVVCNRVTDAGVTSEFDIAFQLGALFFGKNFVEKQELLAEHPDLEKEIATINKSRDDFFKFRFLTVAARIIRL